MSREPVSEDEHLYRSIREVSVQRENGTVVRISSQAFADKQNRISVDRAHLRQANVTQKSATDLVASLVAGEIRAIRYGEHGYSAEVEPDPWPPEAPDNNAHAVIVPRPGDAAKNYRERRMLTLLADLAMKRIVIDPQNG